MDYLARKVQKAKWVSLDYLKDDDISADAITGPCMRTYGNNLSVWECNDAKNDLEEVVLALVLNPKVSHLETIDIVLLQKENLSQAGFMLESTPHQGDTAVKDLQSRHFDIAKLGMYSIYLLANRIASNIRNESSCHRFTRKRIIDIAREAVKAGRVELDSLNEKVKKDLIERR